jgi:hypothetical protein
MAQTLTLTTDTSYYIDNIVSTRGHFDLATGELISGHIGFLLDQRLEFLLLKEVGFGSSS